MKKCVLTLFLALTLLPLPGCAAMLERGHETVTTHVDYAVTEDESILRAESYQGLVNAILYFVSDHRTAGTIRLYNYTGDVEADLANARDEVMYEDPLGAFSLRSLSYGVTRILTYYEVELRIGYSRSAKEVDALPEVTGLAGVRQELAKLVSSQQPSAAFLASYFSGDRELLEKLLNLACLGAPELSAHQGLSAAISLYPETGTRRVIEVKLSLSAQEVEAEKEYAQQLETAAAALLEANPAAGESYTVEELASIVRTAHGGYDYHGAQDALAVFSGASVTESAALMAMEYLCQQCSIEVEPVSSTMGLWLIVATPAGYRHLLPAMLLNPEESASWNGIPSAPFHLYTDQELTRLGWEWDAALHPACEQYDVSAQTLEGLDAGGQPPS